ncbi:hypothetical protein HDV63DRAFT_129605 [Trichoderma sp. SZMC 28014]
MHWHWLRIRIVNHGVCLQTTRPDQTGPGRAVDRGSCGPRCSLFIDHGHLGPYPQSFRPKISFSRLSFVAFLPSQRHLRLELSSYHRACYFLGYYVPCPSHSSSSSPRTNCQAKLNGGNSVVLPKGFRGL